MLRNRIDDAYRASGKIPEGDRAERMGERVGKEGVANIDEAVCLLSLWVPGSCFLFLVVWGNYVGSS